jgi:hypothetical protein
MTISYQTISSFNADNTAFTGSGSSVTVQSVRAALSVNGNLSWTLYCNPFGVYGSLLKNGTQIGYVDGNVEYIAGTTSVLSTDSIVFNISADTGAFPSSNAIGASFSIPCPTTTTPP